MASIYDWSKTAGDNDTSDSAINWQENQVPSTVNNSARQMMGRVAELLSDLGGTVTTSNIGDAYTLTANSAFTTLTDGLIIGFKASATNAGAATLNVNALGSKAIRRVGDTADVAIEAGTIVSGQVYVATYVASANSAAGAWVLVNPATRSAFIAPTTGAIANATGNLGKLEVRGATGADAAYMSFHKPGSFGAYFGIDTDNKFKVGGWSMGANAYDVYHGGNREIPLNTRLIFPQAAAPTGWTQVTGFGDRALRIIDTAGGSMGGSVDFFTFLSRTTTDGHALTLGQMPTHSHDGNTGTINNNHFHSYTRYASKVIVGSDGPPLGGIWKDDAGVDTSNDLVGHTHPFTTNTAGSSQSHAHNIDCRIKYVDAIVCSRSV